MFRKYDNYLATLIIATAGMDRINIGASITDSFLMTPFLVLSIIYLSTRVIFFSKSINLGWFLNNQIFLISFLIFIITLISSSIFSSDILTSSKRLVLINLILVIFILMLSSIRNEHLDQILFNSSVLGSLIFLSFNFLLLLSWIKIIVIDSPFLNLDPDTIAYYVPRLGGFSNDVNRAGFILSFFTYILWISKKNKLYINILIITNIFMIISTLSRSTYLFLIVLTISYILMFQKHLINIKMVFFILLPLLSLFVLTIKLDSLNIIQLDEVIEERFSLKNISNSGSAAIHIALIKQGFNLAISKFKIFILGVGHGASYLFTTGYYWSGSKYGNFHSQYISIFAENGFFSLISFIVFSILFPLLSKNKNVFLPILIGLFFFNIFYQLSSEPLYWFAVLLYYKKLDKVANRNYSPSLNN
tara:strand:- start:2038 stop:3291 length:1254 start_codon:yes stop_codon:yes gene_type:complete